MNTIANFYNWLTPSVPFEFISSHSPDECAALLASKAGMKYGSFFQRLRVEVTLESDQHYAFTVGLRGRGFFKIEAHGTISPVADTYAHIEGSARTRATVFTLILFGYMLAIFGVVVIGMGYSVSTTNSLPAFLVALGLIIIVLSVLLVFQLRSLKGMIAMDVDMALGLLLRSL